MKIEEVYAKAKSKVEALKMTVVVYPKNKEVAAELEAEIIVLSALEKQIPKEPTRYTCENDTCYNHTKCQVCGGGLDSTEKFCRDCGQAIKWR
jgi:hypothetical protein